MSKALRLLLGAIIGMVLALATSAVAEQLFGDPSTYWTVQSITGVTVKENGSSEPLLIPACSACQDGNVLSPTGGKRYRSTQVHFHGAETCCFTLTATGAIDTNGEFGGTAGTCLLGTDGKTWTERPDRAVLLTQAANADYSGLCSEPLVQGLDSLYPPCSSDGDCVYGFGLTGATCTDSPTGTQLLHAGALLKCKGDAEATILKQLIRR